MKLLTTFLSFFLAVTALAATPPTPAEQAFVVQKNLLLNPGFEAGKAQWTKSAGTFSITSTAANVGSGTYAASWTPNAANDTLSHAAVAIPAGLYGQNGEVACKVKSTSGSLHKLQLTDGSNVLADSGVIPAQSGYQLVRVNLVFPSSGSVVPRVLAGDTNQVYVDDCYVGPATNVGTVSQEKYLGRVTFNTCNTYWNASAGSYANYSAVTGCTITTTGVVSSPAQRPAITLPYQGPGNYRFVSTGRHECTGAGGDWTCWFRFYDGTNSSNEGLMTTNYHDGAIPVFSASINYTTAPGSSITVDLQAKHSGAATNSYIDARSGVLDHTLEVYYTPSVAQSVVTPDTTAQSWSGVTSGCSTAPNLTGTTITDFSGGTTGCTVTTTASQNFPTVSLGSVNTSIAWTPNKIGRYLVFANTPEVNTTTGNQLITYLTDGSNNILDSGFSPYSNLGSDGQITHVALLDISNLSQVTLKIRGKITGGGGATGTLVDNYGVGHIRWKILDVSQNMPNPLIVGQVSSSTSGQERIERMTFAEGSGTPCSASPCTINRQSGGFTQVVRNGTGDYTIVANSGVFSGPFTCQVLGPGIVQVANTIADSTHFYFKHYNTSFAALDIYNANVICMGPR